MAETLPILPQRETVLFPDSLTPLAVTTQSAMALVEAAVQGDDRIVLVAVKRDVDGEPGAKDVHRIGTEAIIHRLVRVPDGTVRILVQGVQRVKIERFVGGQPYLRARVTDVPDTGMTEDTELEALRVRTVQVFDELVDASSQLPEELKVVAANVDDAGELCHLVAATLRIGVPERQRILEAADLHVRLRLTLTYLARELEVATLGAKIQSEVHVEMDRTQREWFLRQQLKAIREELGDSEDGDEETADLRAQLKGLALPDEVRTSTDRELSRLARTNEQSAEHGVIRTYLEWIATLPWGTRSEDTLDLGHAKGVLDRDHFGLEPVKERILDHLAVSQLKGGDLAGPILCFVGPPGVGKTSLGTSIATALGRKFSRISVGGIRDESEIRGHRRTYVGSMPGAIIRALRDVGTQNPVFVIDELDKMGSDFRGDPASAMLEVLDPQQNRTFRDHYLDVPFDLSHVLFICTANRVDTIPAALYDRMEIIEVEGYTEAEKLAIATKHLAPRQLRAHGVPRRRVSLPQATLRAVIADYTREAGVRGLDRQIATLSRKAARQIAEHPDESKVTLGPDRLKELLGPARFQGESVRRTQYPGVSTGLAVTSVGGDILYIEASAMPGKGALTITGQIGDVMEESVRAAVSWMRSTGAAVVDAARAESVDGSTGTDQETLLTAEHWFAKHDLHVHVPAGSIPKDGPSAGIAIATALTSLYRGVPARADVAMTGEITLTGEVLPIGGIKGKALAAQRAGIRHVILPERNEPDLEQLPEALRKQLTFHVVDHVSQALAIALPPLEGTAARAVDAGRIAGAQAPTPAVKTKAPAKRAPTKGQQRPRVRTPKATPPSAAR